MGTMYIANFELFLKHEPIVHNICDQVHRGCDDYHLYVKKHVHCNMIWRRWLAIGGGTIIRDD
jgi:hypothetical protein